MIWPENVHEARSLQKALREKVRIEPLKKPPALIAALDAAFSGELVAASACIYSFPGLEFIEEATATMRCRFPYIPGYLSFREGPALMDAIGRLKFRPGLFIFDGQGIAHPEGLGLASHLGVLLDAPSIGCAKSRLVGGFTEPGRKKGRRSPLVYKGRVVGAVLRTRDGVRPLFVSPGHKIDIEGAVDIILRCTPRYRIPEPQRCADRASKRRPAV